MPQSQTDRIRVALYARVSTADQTTDNQLIALRSFAKGRHYDVVHEYIDQGVSGSKTSRPALNEMMTAVRAGTLDALVVFKLDRLGRSLRHLLQVLDELREHEVGFVSATESIDTTTPSGRAMLGLLGVFAEFERAQIVERVQAGIDRARAHGTRLGRPQRWRKEHALLAASLRAEGRSWRAIAMALKIPVRSIRRAVESLNAVEALTAVDLTVAETPPETPSVKAAIVEGSPIARRGVAKRVVNAPPWPPVEISRQPDEKEPPS